jgi:hypothetical protein
MLTVRRFAAGDTPAAMATIRGLPDYFTQMCPQQGRSGPGRAWPARPAQAACPPPAIPGQMRSGVFRKLVTWVWA